MKTTPKNIQRIIEKQRSVQEAASKARQEEQHRRALEARKKREQEFAKIKALALPVIPKELHPYIVMPEDVEGVAEDYHHPSSWRRMTRAFLAVSIPGLAPLLISVVIEDENISQQYPPELLVPIAREYIPSWDWENEEAFVYWDWPVARQEPIGQWQSALLAAANAQRDFNAAQERVQAEMMRHRKQRDANEKRAAQEAAAISRLAQVIGDDPVLRLLVLAFRAVQDERNDFYQRLEEIESAAMSTEEGRSRLASVERTAEEYRRQKESLQSEVFELGDALKDAKRDCRPW